MRKQQEDIKAKQFLNKEDLDDSNFALRTHRRDNARDKNKSFVRKHEKKEI